MIKNSKKLQKPKSVFSKTENAKLNEKRKRFEAEICSSKTPIFTFKEYIKFEESILELAIIRCSKNTNFNDNTKDIFKERCNKKIIKIFDKLVKFRLFDVESWFEYIDFLKRENYFKAITTLFAEMLRVHSTKSKLWIMAAFWELDKNDDIDSARRLLQRGIKIFEYQIKKSLTKNVLKIDFETFWNSLKDDEMKISKRTSEQNLNFEYLGDRKLLWISLFVLEIKNLTKNMNDIGTNYMEHLKIPAFVLYEACSDFTDDDLSFRDCFSFVLNQFAKVKFDNDEHKNIAEKLIDILKLAISEMENNIYSADL
ncbi:U3 snoRNP protein [Bonamia ostreae]|uniref:U3 snoRNP protein n=1 Tax=Bonamia ostreae TaxID=126728 RepID=A0ABV2AGK8_9EUKA